MAKKHTRSIKGAKRPSVRRRHPARPQAPPPGAPAAGAHLDQPPGDDALFEGAMFPIIGIGASAGGLDPLSRVLHLLPATADMALVVVQHLAPQHESVLPHLLGASATLPVMQVRHGMPIKTGHVYVIPPNVEMTIRGGRLHLAPRRDDGTPHHPVDSFFRSLAEYAERRAVGVVLSGSASDGAIGLREIKAVGGITIAQDPATAIYDGMPRAAIATGAIDCILPPEGIAHELTRLSQHPFMREALAVVEPDETAFTEQQFEQLCSLLRQVSGVDFRHYKLPTIRRRVQRRMVLHKVTQVDDYLEILRATPEEVHSLYRDVLIHVTRFFREPESFDALKRLVFPHILETSVAKRPIRIWVPGCATGEEAYSVAITLLEHLGAESTTTAIQVFATDVSEEAVERAREGLYPESIAVDVSPERLRRFFTRVDGQYRVNKLVRDSCVFARQDLTRDPPFSKLDLIVCRNVLIYLGVRLQRKLISVFHYALKTSGFLMLGSTESVGAYAELFTVVEQRHKIYSTRPGSAHAEFDFGDVRPGRGDLEKHKRMPARVTARPASLHGDVTRTLLARYSPPGVLVDETFQIIQSFGKTGPYLELASGDATLNLLKMAREGLRHGLRSALKEVLRTKRPARRPGLVLEANGASRETDLQVIPIERRDDSPYLLVLFEPAKRAVVSSRARAARSTPAETREIDRMQQELTSSREYLQSIITDLESANEELQLANEEILSSNEELQSTNEELDTAKEELQSTNEELNTVNEELNARNEELSYVNSDLMNLLTAVPTAVVMVSSDLRIRRFTPLAEHILNLIPTDVGRPLGDLKPNIDADNLEQLTREVIATVATKELETHDRSGRLYSVRIRPYKNLENRIDGAVLAFADMHSARLAPSDGARHLVIGLVDAIAAPIVVLGEQRRVFAANRPLADLLDTTADAMLGRELRELPRGRWENPPLLAALERLEASGEPFRHLPVPVLQPADHVVHVDGARLPRESSRQPLLVLTVWPALPFPAQQP